MSVLRSISPLFYCFDYFVIPHGSVLSHFFRALSYIDHAISSELLVLMEESLNDCFRLFQTAYEKNTKLRVRVFCWLKSPKTDPDQVVDNPKSERLFSVMTPNDTRKVSKLVRSDR